MKQPSGDDLGYTSGSDKIPELMAARRTTRNGLEGLRVWRPVAAPRCSTGPADSAYSLFSQLFTWAQWPLSPGFDQIGHAVGARWNLASTKVGMPSGSDAEFRGSINPLSTMTSINNRRVIHRIHRAISDDDSGVACLYWPS